MKKIVIINILCFFLFISLNKPMSAFSTYKKKQGIKTELTGFFVGLTSNRYNTEDHQLSGSGWQAGIIQKTEQRIYGYLTGLLYFEHATVEGNLPELGKTSFTMNDVVFSLWMTQIIETNPVFSPTISLGPAFVFKTNSRMENGEDSKNYRNMMFDLKLQVSVGSYILLKKDLFLKPQFTYSYNLLNNNHIAKDWKVNSENNFAFQLGLLYNTDY